MKLLRSLETTLNNAAYKLLSIVMSNDRVDRYTNPSSIKRVLFLRYDVLGDMICTYPAIKFLKKEIPGVEIDILASHRNSFLIKEDSLFRKIYHFDGKILKNLLFLLKLRKNNYDVIFATYYVNMTKNGVIANLAGSKNTVKANVYDKEKRYLFFNFQSKLAQQKSNMFEKMHYLVSDLIGKTNSTNLQLDIPRDKESEDIVLDYLKNNDLEKYIVINVSSGKDDRRWSESKLIRLINNLSELYTEYQFVVINMPDEERIAEKIVEESNKTFLFGQASLFEIIELIDKAELVITPDTSIVHICSVVNTKVCVFTFENIVNEGVWVPYKVENRLIIAKQNSSMKDIEFDYVFNSVRELLDE